jgi:hypothetical protein
MDPTERRITSRPFLLNPLLLIVLILLAIAIEQQTAARRPHPAQSHSALVSTPRITATR